MNEIPEELKEVINYITTSLDNQEKIQEEISKNVNIIKIISYVFFIYFSISVILMVSLLRRIQSL